MPNCTLEQRMQQLGKTYFDYFSLKLNESYARHYKYTQMAIWKSAFQTPYTGIFISPESLIRKD